MRKLFRARLNDADRLIFSLVRRDDEDLRPDAGCRSYNHDYDHSRFLRGAVIDEAKILDCDAAEAAKEAEPLRYLNA